MRAIVALASVLVVDAASAPACPGGPTGGCRDPVPPGQKVFVGDGGHWSPPPRPATPRVAVPQVGAVHPKCGGSCGKIPSPEPEVCTPKITVTTREVTPDCVEPAPTTYSTMTLPPQIEYINQGCNSCGAVAAPTCATGGCAAAAPVVQQIAAPSCAQAPRQVVQQVVQQQAPPQPKCR